MEEWHGDSVKIVEEWLFGLILIPGKGWCYYMITYYDSVDIIENAGVQYDKVTSFLLEVLHVLKIRS